MSAEALYPSPEEGAVQCLSPQSSEKSWAVAGPDEDLNFGSLMALQEPGHGEVSAEVRPVPPGPSTAVPLFQDDWHSMNSRLVAMRTQQFKYPWEVTSRSVRPRLNASGASLFPNPLLGRFDRPAPTRVFAVSSEPWAWTARNTFEARRLLAARFAKTDDQMLLAAFKKIRSIVLFHPEDSALGRSLVATAGLLVEEGVLSRSIEDAFAGKAPGTLLKRACDFTRFAEWAVRNRIRPLAPSEPQVYDFVSFLRHSGASPTSADSFVKALRFFMHHTGAYLSNPISARVSGVASSMEIKKRPLWQAPPLPVSHVRALEEFVIDTQDHARACIAGFLVFCIYASSRFSDAARAKGVTIDASGGAVVILETGTAHYKTRAKDRQNRMLPLLALGRTLVQPGWGGAWVKHREAAGISDHSCLMPALAPSSSWLQRPMTAGEGSLWLREILHLASVSGDLEAYTSHSLKATALSWSAKSGTMSYEERLTQGHHVHPKLGMALLYSRDAMAEIMVKVGRVVRAIAGGAFSPDLPRAQRVALALQKAPEDFAHLPETQPDLVDGEDEAHESEGEGSDLSDTDLLKGLQALNLPSAPDAVRPRIEATFGGKVFMHILTGVVHCEASPGRLKCGRHVTANMRLMSQGEAQNHVCQQCAAADSGA